MKRRFEILDKLGITIPKEARILDLGCGWGQKVYWMLDQGFINTVGYDINDTLKLRDPADRSLFFIGDAAGGNRLPYEDNTFDFVITEMVLEHVMDQVGFFREMHRVMRPGGCSIHVFAPRYGLIESHMYVPFGSVLGHRWWYKLWALLGIRNEDQKGLSADEVADRNAFYFVGGVNYISNSCYEVVWRRLGYEYKWIDQEFFDTSERALVRGAGNMNRKLSIIAWLYRTFHTRRVVLTKPKWTQTQ